MLGLDLVAIFRESYARITSELDRNQKFLDHFYVRFMRADPEIAEKFAQTDMGRQKIMLRDSLLVMASFFSNSEVTEELDGLARLHGPRRLEIPDRLYDIWLECLSETVQEIDPGWNRDVELAWRVIMAPGIALMKWM